MYTTVSSSSYTGANSISGSVTYSSGPNFLYIYNLALQNNGMVYIIVGDPNVWPRAPVISEIKTGSGPNGLPPVFFRVLSYRTSNANSGNMAWTSFTGGPYNMYIVVSDDNPFDTATFGTITSYTIQRETAAWEQFISLAILLVVCMML